MEKLLRETLLLLNLEPKEIKFFESSFFLGPASINEITKHAKLERSTSYLIARQLIQKGLLEEDFKQYRKKIAAISPQKLLTILKARARRLGRQELELEEHLAELTALSSTSPTIPKIKVYEGTTGLLSIWQDILSIQQEILLWTNQETEHKFFTPENHEKFIRDRVARQISMKVLAVHNKNGKQLFVTDDTCLRETKMLPKPVTFSAETYIYGNKVAIIDWNKDIFGIILENEQITASQRAMFLLQWNS
ncbi:hypothetical protein BH11PAT1_BH11PAT1_1120 [soil metagenome]